MLTVEIVADVTGCGSIDPTDPQNYSVVNIPNDTTGPVVVDDCKGAYSMCRSQRASAPASGSPTVQRAERT